MKSLRSVDSHTRQAAVALFIIGAVFFIVLMFQDIGKLIYDDATNIVSKYFPLIAIINGGIIGVVGGVLLYKGVLVPYHSESVTKKDKARTEIFGLIGTSPFFFSASITVFFESDSTIWKGIWSLALLYIVFLFISSVRIIMSKGNQGQTTIISEKTGKPGSGPPYSG